MVFIGIVTDSKSQKNIEKLLMVNKFLKNNKVIFLKDKNINNMKNIHFDTIIINSKNEENGELADIIKNAKRIILNTDVSENTNIDSFNGCVITYGFNSKADITISSVTDDNVLIYVQKNLKNNSCEDIEVQEIKIENSKNYTIYDLIIVLVLFLIFFPEIQKININNNKNNEQKLH